MKNRILIISFMMIFTLTKAQKNHLLDTIYANDKKNVALFFPEPIRQGITGSENFVFTYNREKGQYFGLLKASSGIESNLLTITSDGQIYSYIIKYSKKLNKLNYFIKQKESIGNETPTKKKKQAKNNILGIDKLVYNSRTNVYAKNCKSYLKNTRRPINISKQKYHIELSIKNIVFHNDALYYLMEIKNNSKIDYQMNYLRFFTISKSNFKRKSSQKLQIKPVYSYLSPKRIKANYKTEFVIVLPKFSIDNQKNILVELNELKGERNLELKLPNGSI